MSPRQIRLPEEIRDQIRKHALEAYPAESCGLLFGRIRGEEAKILRALSVDNRCEDDSRNTHYRMDPLTIHKLEQSFEEEGLLLIGFYHSHPDHAGLASKEDIREMIPKQIYLIQSVRNGSCSELSAWIKITEGETDDEQNT